MIKCDSKRTTVRGSGLQVIEDLMNVLVAVRKVLEKDLPRESANKIIAVCGKVAFSEDGSEEEQMAMDELKATLDEVGAGLTEVRSV